MVNTQGTVNTPGVSGYDLKLVRLIAEAAQASAIVQLDYSKVSNVHLMTGLDRTGLVPVQFTCDADYVAGETITIDAIRYMVALNSGDTPEGTVWKAGTSQLGLCDTENSTLIIISAKDKVPEHNVDPAAHPDIRETLRNHEAALSKINNVLFSNITGNPFNFIFDSADPYVIEGTLNEELDRVEF